MVQCVKGTRLAVVCWWSIHVSAGDTPSDPTVGCAIARPCRWTGLIGGHIGLALRRAAKTVNALAAEQVAVDTGGVGTLHIDMVFLEKRIRLMK